MSLERKYENCKYCKNRGYPLTCEKCDNGYCYTYRFELDELAYKLEFEFEHNSKEIIKNERNKIITLLKSDLENFDGLADDCVEGKDIHELLQNNAVRKYIEETILLLEKEA